MDIDIDTLFENDYLLAINKPTGIAVHEDGRSSGPFVTDWVRRTRPDLIGVGEPMRLQNGNLIDRPGVVHRLDRETSGVLVLAKTQPAFLVLKRGFQTHMVEKEYRAFVWGELKDPTGTIDKPIGRSRKDFRLWSAGSDAGGALREAVTRYTRLCAGYGFSYVAFFPKTGRTHQIRVHAKSIGHPVVCDARYAPSKAAALGFSRLALHACALALTDPDGTRLVIEAPLPDDFERASRVVCGQA